MTDLFDRVLLPVASEDDARKTSKALERQLAEGREGRTVVAIHVVEKAGGAPDKASVEQRELAAEEMFDVVEGYLADHATVETDVRYGTDVVDAIFEAAADHDASAVVFVPRGGSRWIRLLTGDVALSMLQETDRPVIALPAEGEADPDATDVAADETDPDAADADEVEGDATDADEVEGDATDSGADAAGGDPDATDSGADPDATDSGADAAGADPDGADGGPGADPDAAGDATTDAPVDEGGGETTEEGDRQR